MQNLDAEALIESVAAQLNRGLSLEDVDGLLLAYSSNQPHADKVRVNFLLSKRVPADVNAWQLSHGVSVAVRPVVVPANADLGMLGRVCVPLMVRGYRVGYIWVQQDDGEESAAGILAELPRVRPQLDLLAALLLESNTAESSQRRATEQQFIAACDGDRPAAVELLTWPQLHGGGPWQVVCAVEDAPNPSQDPVAATQTHRASALQATVGLDAVLFTAGHSTHSLLLFAAGPGRASHAEALVRYQRELGKRLGREPGRMVLGASAPVHSSGGFPQAYRQARVAAQAGIVEPGLGELVDCARTGIYQLFPEKNWAPPQSLAFSALRSADTNRELLPVLELLYDNEGSVQRVADELHLHRSSVYNRLGKVRQLLGADPQSGALRLEIHSALKAERWLRRPRLA